MEPRGWVSNLGEHCGFTPIDSAKHNGMLTETILVFHGATCSGAHEGGGFSLKWRSLKDFGGRVARWGSQKNGLWERSSLSANSSHSNGTNKMK